MKSTYNIIKDNYHMKPEKVGEALVEFITNIKDVNWLQTGPHRDLVASLDTCIDPNNSSPDCILDVVEKVISVFMNDSDSLGVIASHLEKSATSETQKDILLAQSYIHEVYLSSRGMDIGESKQKKMLTEIKIDILRQQEVSEKNRDMIHSLQSNLEVNEALDAQQSELIDTLEAQLSEKASLDNEQSELIDQIRKAFVEKTLIDIEQSQVLEKLESVLAQKGDIDEKQTQSLLKIKEELISKTIKDIEQSSAIDRLETKMYDMQLEIESLNRKYREAGQGALERDRSVYQKINKTNILMTLMIVYMLILSLSLFLRS